MLRLCPRLARRSFDHAVKVCGYVRARMCESLAASPSRDADRAFLAGLLSVVDALTDRTLVEAIDHLPIDDELKGAIVMRDGPLSDLMAVWAPTNRATSPRPPPLRSTHERPRMPTWTRSTRKRGQPGWRRGLTAAGG